MDIIFPPGKGFAGSFFTGFRKDPAHPAGTQRVGTVLLKRTYVIDPALNPAAGSLTPASPPLPVFAADQPLPPAPLRFESDLAAFKPEADAIVLGFTGTPGVTSLKVDGQTWLTRTLSPGEAHIFGWDSKSGDGPGSRQADAGTFSENPAHYPPQWPVQDPNRDPLPGSFNNRFYNGYHRQARAAGGLPALPYFDAGARVLIQRPGPSDDYGFTLGHEIVSARLFYYRGFGPDEECRWRSQAVPLHLDTLVVEPDLDRCYAVWRGVWNLDEHPLDVYRRLVVSVSE